MQRPKTKTKTAEREKGQETKTEERTVREREKEKLAGKIRGTERKNKGLFVHLLLGGQTKCVKV